MPSREQLLFKGFLSNSKEMATNIVGIIGKVAYVLALSSIVSGCIGGLVVFCARQASFAHQISWTFFLTWTGLQLLYEVLYVILTLC